jgi:hypothetical protein
MGLIKHWSGPRCLRTTVALMFGYDQVKIGNESQLASYVLILQQSSPDRRTEEFLQTK